MNKTLELTKKCNYCNVYEPIKKCMKCLYSFCEKCLAYDDKGIFFCKVCNDMTYCYKCNIKYSKNSSKEASMVCDCCGHDYCEKCFKEFIDVLKLGGYYDECPCLKFRENQMILHECSYERASCIIYYKLCSVCKEKMSVNDGEECMFCLRDFCNNCHKKYKMFECGNVVVCSECKQKSLKKL